MLAAVAFVLGGPCVRVDWMQRAVAGIDIDARNAHVTLAVGVVHDWARAAKFDSLGASGWGCVGVHRSFRIAFTRSMNACLLS